MKREKVILRRTMPDKFNGKKWSYKTDEIEVVVLAVADGYAMVRRKGCLPFVANLNDLVGMKVA